MGLDSRVRQQRKARAIFTLDLPSRRFWSGNEHFGNDNCQKTLRCKSRGSEWLSIAQCGFDSGFRRPRPEALFSRVGHSFATGQAIFACPPCCVMRVFELRSEPWKGLQADSRKIRQKRAEAAAQRLAGLAGLGCFMGRVQMASGTWNMARLITPPLLTTLAFVTELIKQAVRFNRGKLFRPRLLPVQYGHSYKRQSISGGRQSARQWDRPSQRGITEPAERRRRSFWRPRQ